VAGLSKAISRSRITGQGRDSCEHILVETLGQFGMYIFVTYTLPLKHFGFKNFLGFFGKKLILLFSND